MSPVGTIRLDASSVALGELMKGLRALFSAQRLCDVTLKSREGVEFEAHRLVLSAASEAFGALLSGHFMESQGGPIQLDASAGALQVVLDYIYGKQLQMKLSDASHVLKLAHMYGLEGLQRELANCLRGQLDATSAIQLLQDCECLGHVDLIQHCENVAASNFEDCLQVEEFNNLSASQLGRLLKHSKLAVSSEECILKGVLGWCHAIGGRDLYLGLLSQNISFPLLSAKTLRAAKRKAQTMGPCGIDIEREATVALRIHSNGGVLDGGPPPKRSCLEHWWADLGSSALGGVTVAGNGEQGHELNKVVKPGSMTIFDRALFIADRWNRRVMRWPFGDSAGQVVAGQGAPVNGVNDIGDWCSIHVSFDGDVFVADYENNRVLRFANGIGEVVGKGLWDVRAPRGVHSTRSGVLYVLDSDGQRVQKFHGDVASTVVVSNGDGVKLDQFEAPFNGLFVNEVGVLYITDISNDRVLRWAPGAAEATIAAGGNGRGSAQNQLSHPVASFVTPDETVYVADRDNHRIMKWEAGARKGVAVAGGNGAGSAVHQLNHPRAVLLDDAGDIYVCESSNHRVTRWAPKPVPNVL